MDGNAIANIHLALADEVIKCGGEENS